MNDIRLAVFDLDGTLIDSSADLANAVNVLLSDLGVAPLPDPQIVSMVGEGAAVLVRRALAASGLDPQTPGALDRFLDSNLRESCRLFVKNTSQTAESCSSTAFRFSIAVGTSICSRQARPTNRSSAYSTAYCCHSASRFL